MRDSLNVYRRDWEPSRSTVHDVSAKPVEHSVENGRSDAIRRDRCQKDKPEIQDSGKGQIAREQQDELIRDRIGHAQLLQDDKREDRHVAIFCDVDGEFGRQGV